MARREGEPVRPAPLPDWAKVQKRWRPAPTGEVGPRAMEAQRASLQAIREGKPAVDASGMRTRTQGVRLWGCQYAELQRGAEAMGTTVSALMRAIIEEWLQANRKPWAKR